MTKPLVCIDRDAGRQRHKNGVDWDEETEMKGLGLRGAFWDAPIAIHSNFPLRERCKSRVELFAYSVVLMNHAEEN